MNDEIKEILDSIQEHLKENEENFKKGAVDSTVYYLYCDDARTLLDYITNLQEENMKLINENETIKNIKYTVEETIYKSRNEKAIEFLDNEYNYKKGDAKFNRTDYVIWQSLKNILNGTDE